MALAMALIILVSLWRLIDWAWFYICVNTI